MLKVGECEYDANHPVHEIVKLERECGTLDHPFIHYNYKDIAQFHQKQTRYNAYYAGIMQDQGIRPKPQNYVLQPLRQVWWRFVTLKGYIDGWHGLCLSVLMGWYEFQKYVALAKLWQNFTP